MLLAKSESEAERGAVRGKRADGAGTSFGGAGPAPHLGEPPGGLLGVRCSKEPICNFPPVALRGVWKLSTKLFLELPGQRAKISLLLRLGKPARKLSSFGRGTGGLGPIVAGTAVFYDLIVDLPGF